MCVQDGIVGNKREKEKGRKEQESDEFGSLPVNHSLSAMFTLAALSPPAPKPRRCPPGINIHSYRPREGARSIVHEGRNGEIISSRKCDGSLIAIKIRPLNSILCFESLPFLWEE